MNSTGFSSRRTLILDRDGVINTAPEDYVKSWEEFEFLPGVLEGLALLQGNGFRVLVATNQSCVGRGIITQEELSVIHRNMMSRVEAAGGRIERIYQCTCEPEDGCDCRKPKPGMLFEAARDFDLDLSHCFFAGDALTDLKAGKTAGCRTILVLTGKGLKTLDRVRLGEEPAPDLVFSDLSAAAEWLIGKTA